MGFYLYSIIFQLNKAEANNKPNKPSQLKGQKFHAIIIINI